MGADSADRSALERAGHRIVQRLREAGFEGYFAGGYVRNRLLGRPIKDIDIATSAPPEQIERLFPRTVPVGRAFGVILVLQEEFKFEVATFRADGPYRDGRRPESVTFTDLQNDVRRRDFTINGLVFDPANGRIIDFVEGRKDLEARLIRTIGRAEDRFEEDKLRLLRAIRFATVLEFDIEEETWTTLKRLAPEIKAVSGERIRDELQHLLVAPSRERGLELLGQSGLLGIVLPEVAEMKGVPQPPNFHPEGDVWVHTKLCMSKLKDPSFEVALGALLHDVGKPRTITFEDRIRFTKHEIVGARIAEDICRRLRLSREQIERVSWLVANHLAFVHVEEMRPSTLKRFISQKYFADLEEVHRVDALSSNQDLSKLEFVRKFREQQPALQPDPLLRGRDLVELGFVPGPAFGKVLRAAYDAQLEGRLTTREEAMEFARHEFKEPP